MILNGDERAVVLLDSLSKFEYVHKFGLFESLPSPSAIFTDYRLIERYFKKTGNEAYASALIKVLKDEKLKEELIAGAVSGADGVITYWSEDYPKELKTVSKPPLALYYRGNKNLLKSEKKFAIVGSRKTLGEYEAKAESVAKKLSESGVTIVTGIAEGGDKAAIDGAIGSGRIISVFAGGVDIIYPKRHEDLINKIAKSGLIISEMPCGAPSIYYMFIMRNRIIAALGNGTLIVGGGETSGTRHTAEFALEYGKEVCCFPYGFGEAGRICKTLIKNGAAMVESAEEIAELMGYKLNEEREKDLSDEERAILKIIEEGTEKTDEIIEKSPLPLQKTIETLAMLEIKRIVKKNLDAYGII